MYTEERWKMYISLPQKVKYVSTLIINKIIKKTTTHTHQRYLTSRDERMGLLIHICETLMIQDDLGINLSLYLLEFKLEF